MPLTAGFKTMISSHSNATVTVYFSMKSTENHMWAWSITTGDKMAFSRKYGKLNSLLLIIHHVWKKGATVGVPCM